MAYHLWNLNCSCKTVVCVSTSSYPRRGERYACMKFFRRLRLVVIPACFCVFSICPALFAQAPAQTPAQQAPAGQPPAQPQTPPATPPKPSPFETIPTAPETTPPPPPAETPAAPTLKTEPVNRGE